MSPRTVRDIVAASGGTQHRSGFAPETRWRTRRLSRPRLAAGGPCLMHAAPASSPRWKRSSRAPGRRLLTVGTDCSVGKMYTTLALDKEMRSRGIEVDSSAPPDRPAFSSPAGVCPRCARADFISAARVGRPGTRRRRLGPHRRPGLALSPSFAGCLARPAARSKRIALVLCPRSTTTDMRGLPHYPCRT